MYPSLREILLVCGSYLPFLVTSSYMSGSCIGKCRYSELLFIFAATGKRDILPRPMKGIRKKWEEIIISRNNFSKNHTRKGVENYDD